MLSDRMLIRPDGYGAADGCAIHQLYFARSAVQPQAPQVQILKPHSPQARLRGSRPSMVFPQVEHS